MLLQEISVSSTVMARVNKWSLVGGGIFGRYNIRVVGGPGNRAADNSLDRIAADHTVRIQERATFLSCNL